MTLLRFFSLLLLTLLAVPAAVSANPVPLSGQLTDAAQKPLSYASIGIINTSVGTVADVQGAFTLYLNNNVKDTDTVRIGLLGYRSLNATVAEFRQQLTANPRLIMIEEPHQLNEVRIDASKSKAVTKGKNSTWSVMHTNFALSELPRQNLGSEIGRRFDVSKGQNRLERFRFYVASGFDKVQFRLNVYRADDMVNLVPKNVYISLPGKGGRWVEVDLLPLQLVVSDDVVVAIQWIDSAGAGKYLQMPIEVPALATHYYRYGSQDRWKKFRGMTTSMNLTFTRSRG